MKIKINKSVIANVQGKSVEFEQGEIVSLDEESADNLVRGHYAELLKENKPATKVQTAPAKVATKVKAKK